MKFTWAIVVVALQVAVLVFMAAQREWVVRAGEVMFLRTAPIDPRDPMRGDYVRFNYEIGDVPRALCRDGVTTWFTSDWKQRRALTDRRVFASVEVDAEGVAHLVALSDQRPESGRYLRGRVASIDDRRVNVRYGVEAFFMQQGKARVLEVSPLLASGVPLNIEVAVSRGGLAVAKGYRWEPLGIALHFEWREFRTPDASPQTRRVLDALTVELTNHGERPVGIVVRPNGGSFRIVADERWSPVRYRWVGENNAIAPATAEMVRLLAPGTSYRERLDVSQPPWLLHDLERPADAAPVTWLDVAGMWNARFRLEYVAVSPEERSGLPHAELIRTSLLRSRGFNAGGGVD